MRRRLVVMLVVLIACSSRADAQSAVPSGVIVRDGDGALWLVSNGVRARVPVYPAAAEQVAAIPPTDRWLVPNADGGLTLGDQPEWAQIPTAPAATAQAVELSGAENQNTRAFPLAAGTYTARWSVKLQPRQTSCFVSARLRRVEDQGTAATIINTTVQQQVATAANAETQLYGVKAGQYYVAVETTGCDWSVSITPSP